MNYEEILLSLEQAMAITDLMSMVAEDSCVDGKIIQGLGRDISSIIMRIKELLEN